MKKTLIIILFAALLILSGCSRWFRAKRPSEGGQFARPLLESVDGLAYSGAGMPWQEDFNTNEFSAIEPNRFQRADLQPLSTFSIDVDTGGYSIVRKFLNDNQLPPSNIIRTEELINYFDYDYPQPTGEQPFSIYTELGSCPWNEKRQLVHIGLKGLEVPTKDLPASNLVFLVDVSGSMDEPNKLPLVQSALSMLTDQLRESDNVSIVVYAGAAGIVLPPTSGRYKDQI